MASPRLHVASYRRSKPVPLTPAAEAIREHLAIRRQRLDALSPEAVDLAAEVLAALHEGIRGRAAELRGTQSPEYRRQQLLGRSSLPIEALAYLALHEPAGVAHGLAVLAAACGFALQPLVGAASSVAAEGSDVARSAGELTAELVGALEDGAITAAERADLRARLAAHKRELSELEAALVRLGGRTA